MKAPWIVRVWWRLLDVLHVRHWQAGDSTARYVITDPWDAWYGYGGRVVCRLFGRHNVSCRGRADHPKEARR